MGTGTHAPTARVAFCIDTFDIGGTELNAVRLAEHLVLRGMQLEVVAMKEGGPLLRRYEAAGIPVSTYPFQGFASVGAAAQCLRLRRHLRDNRIDVIHCHDYYSNILGAAASLRNRGLVLITSRRWSTKHPPKLLQRLNGWVSRRADCVLANSARLRDELVRDDHVAPGRIVVISNFVDEHALVPLEAGRRAWWRQRFGIPHGAMAVGCVSRLAQVKNFGALLDAVAGLGEAASGVHILLIGDGTTRAALSRQAQELGLTDRLHITGFQAAGEENLQGVLDIVVLPSTSEGFPNAVIEGMAAGVPVIATDVGGVPDVVADQVTGLLVPPADPDRLGAALMQLLRDAGLRTTLARAARERVIAENTADRIVGQTQSLYSSLLEESQQPHFTDVRRGYPPCLTRAPCTTTGR